jgi:protein-S-isoprenylcysteine O-methyltransferase Ste14
VVAPERRVADSRLPSLGPRGEGWVVLQFLLLALVALAGLLDGAAWSGGLASLTTLLGLALMAGGALLVGRGLLDLGRNLTPVPHPRDDAHLVEAGVYALVRHPIYGGLIATAAGWGLVAASPLTLLLAGVLALFFRLKSRREEIWLGERYPDYAAYATRTKRFFPYLY